LNSIRGPILGVLVLICMAVVPGAASAATCTDTWDGGSGGEWTAGGDWSTGSMPAEGSHVCIEKPVTVVMTYYTPPKLASLDVGGETTSGTAKLQIGISDVVKVEATTIGAHGVIDLDGTYNGANAGNATLGGGTVTNQGAIEMKGHGYSATLYGSVLNEGTISVPFGGVIMGGGESGGAGSLDNKGTITVAPASADPSEPAVIKAEGFPVTDDTGGSIVNEGTFYVKSAYNSGTVEGSYIQGNGTETGKPIEIGQNSELAYTGAGASSIAVADSLGMTGSLSAGQSLQVGIGTVVTEPSSFTNAGAITLNGNYYGGGGGPAEIALSSGTFTNTGTLTAESNDNSPTLSGNFENKGTVSIKPGTTIEQVVGTFVNASGGTLAPQISSSASGEVQIDGETSFLAGGTLAPVLVEGFVPTVGQEFHVVGIRGGSWSGEFGAVIDGFGADYSNSGYIGAIYGGGVTGPTPTPAPSPAPSPAPVAPTAKVSSVTGGAGSITIKLSCAAGGANCAKDTVRATVTEHLKHGKLKSVSAVRNTKVVVVASGSASLKAGAVEKLKLKLNRTGEALLKRYRSLAVIVTITSGGKKIKTVTVHIHEPVKHHKG
jgi:hypothetical protein